MSHYANLLIGIVMLVSFQTTSAEKVVITDSSVSDYPKGSTFSAKTRVTIPKGKFIEFRDARKKEGEISYQKGYFSDDDLIKKDGKKETLFERWLDFLDSRAPEKRTDDVRGIDISYDQTFCFAKEYRDKLYFKGKNPDETLVLTLTDKKKGVSITHDWLLTDEIFPWPKELPPNIGEPGYSISVNNKRSHKLILYQMPETITETEEAPWMLGEKCLRQAILLNDKIRNAR